MTQKTLRAVLSPPPENTNSLRWRAAVPIGTNPFLLLELFQFAFVAGAIVLITLCLGVYFTEGGIAVEDIATSLHVAGFVLLGVMIGFIGISVLFLNNRYYAMYHMDHSGIYHEGTRGTDESNELFCLRFRPFPVIGTVRTNSTRSRNLTWDKVDRFQDISSMRVFLLRRNFWHLLRLYTPDAETHDKVARYLAEHLRQV